MTTTTRPPTGTPAPTAATGGAPPTERNRWGGIRYPGYAASLLHPGPRGETAREAVHLTVDGYHTLCGCALWRDDRWTVVWFPASCPGCRAAWDRLA